MALTLEDLKRTKQKNRPSFLIVSNLRKWDEVKPSRENHPTQSPQNNVNSKRTPTSLQFPWDFSDPAHSSPSTRSPKRKKRQSKPSAGEDEPSLITQARQVSVAYVREIIRINRRRHASGKGFTLLSPLFIKGFIKKRSEHP